MKTKHTPEEVMDKLKIIRYRKLFKEAMVAYAKPTEELNKELTEALEKISRYEIPNGGTWNKEIQYLVSISISVLAKSK